MYDKKLFSKKFIFVTLKKKTRDKKQKAKN